MSPIKINKGNQHFFTQQTIYEYSNSSSKSQDQQHDVKQEDINFEGIQRFRKEMWLVSGAASQAQEQPISVDSFRHTISLISTILEVANFRGKD